MQASEATLTGLRTPLGYQQILAATLAAATGFTVPAATGYVVVQCSGGAVRWRDDGTDPTSTVGMTLNANCELCYVGNFYAMKFIVSSSAPILDITYYAP